MATSITSYAKFVDVASKVTGADQVEQAQVRREKLRIEAIRAVLAEMMPDED